jgi:hypothetical protein
MPPPKYKVLSYQSTKAEIKEAVIEEFGHDMAKIIECESGYNVKAINTNTNKSQDKTIFQINSSHRKLIKDMGYDYDTLTVPQSFEVARKILQIQGKRAWVCYRKIYNVK